MPPPGDDIPDLFPTPAGGGSDGIPDLFPAPAAAPEDPRDQIRRVTRPFMEADPALDAYTAAEKAYQSQPYADDMGMKAPQAPVISSYQDPRYKNFQAKIGAKLGRTVPADLVSGYLQTHGYRIDQNAMDQGDAGRDPNKVIGWRGFGQGGPVIDPMMEGNFGEALLNLLDNNIPVESRGVEQAVIGAAKQGANITDLVGALDPRQSTNIQTNPNQFQQQAAESRQGIGQLESQYAPSPHFDAMMQSLAPLLMTLGPAKLAATGATAAGAGEGLASSIAGGVSGVQMGALSSPEVYRDSVEHGMTQGQALGNVGASIGIQGVGMAAGGAVAPFKGLTALAQPSVRQFAEGRIVDATKRAMLAMPSHVGQGAAVMGVTTGMDTLRQLLTTHQDMTVDQALAQVENSIVDGSLFGATGGVLHGMGEVGRAAAGPQMRDQVGRMAPETRQTDTSIAPDDSFEGRLRAARAQVPSGEIPDLFARGDALENEFLSNVNPTVKFDKNDLRRQQEADAGRPTEQPVDSRQGAPTDTVISDANHPAIPDLFGPRVDRGVEPGDSVSGRVDRSEPGRGSEPTKARESEIFGGGNQAADENVRPDTEAGVREPTGTGSDLGRADGAVDQPEHGGDATRSVADGTESAVFGRVEQPAERAGARAPSGRNPAAAGAGGDAQAPVLGETRHPDVRPGPGTVRDAENAGRTGQPDARESLPGAARPGRDAPGRRGPVDAEAAAFGGGDESAQLDQGPVRLRAGANAPDGVKRVVERINKQLDNLPALPDKLPQNPAGNGHGPGNPKYRVPLRPDMTYAEFKARIDPKDAALLDKAKGNKDAAKKLKERFGWSEQHNAIAKPYENTLYNIKRGFAGDLQGGTNKNVGGAHQALNEAGRQNAGRGRSAPEGEPDTHPADRTQPADAPQAEKVGVPAHQPVVEPRRAPVAPRVDTEKPVGKKPAANDRYSVAQNEDGKVDVVRPRAGRGDRVVETHDSMQEAQHRADELNGRKPISPEVTLPRDLSKISPRYGYRDQNFQLQFKSDLDRGAYALANKGTRSKAHTRILDALKAQTGMSEAELVAHGQKVRDAVKVQAKENYGKVDAEGDPIEKIDVPKQQPPKPKLSATEPVEFSHEDFAGAERVDAGSASPEHQAAVDVAEHLGLNAEVAHLPENVEGAYNPSTGDVLINANVPEGDVGRVFGHELTHDAIDKLPADVRAELVRQLRESLGPAETERLLEQARKKWGADLGDDALLHEMLADGGGSIVQRRGVNWLIGDRTAWQHVTDWMDRTVDKLRAKLGDSNAKARRVIEQVIHDYGRARSTTHQNGANLAYESHFKGNHEAAIKFAIRDLARHDDRFLMSSRRKFEKAFGKLGKAGVDLTEAGAQIVRRVMSPSYFAGRFPAFADVFSANRAREEHQIKILDQLRHETPTFASMDKKEVAPVNKVLDWQNIHQVELTNTQLEQRGLTDRQVQAVLEFRHATKSVMDARRQAIAYHFGKPGSPPVAVVRADAAAAANPTEKARLNLLADLLEKHDQLVRPGYVPRMRFGSHRKLVVSDIATGDVLHYDHAETPAEFAEKHAALQKQYAGQLTGANAALHLDTGFLVDRADTESYGFTESDITAMARAANVDPKILDDFLSGGVREHLMSKGFNRHLLPSNNTPGYSTDFQRALASYALSASHGISLMRFNADIKSPMQRMATEDQALHQYATRYKDYMLNRQNDGAWLRNLAFMKYLGFNVGSAVTNLTQVPLVTAPFMFALSGSPTAVVGSWKNALESVAAAFGEVGGNAALALKGKDPNLDMVELYADHIQQKNPALAAALRAARASGIMTQADVRSFTAMAQRGGNTTAGKAARGFANAAAFPFAKSERAVRLATFVAAHELATKSPANSTFWRRANDLGYHGQPGDAAKLASWVVDETQGIYGKANRPELFRHWATAPLYIFKQFGQNVLTTGYKLAKVGLNEARTGNVANAPLGAVAAYFAQSVIAGGIWNALPGGQTLKSSVNSLWSMHGGKRDIESELDKLLGPIAGEAVNRGGLGFLPGPLGEYGPAIGRRSGLGNIVPPADDLGAILGPGLGAIRDTASDIGMLTSGDPWAQAKGVSDLVAGRTGKGLVDAAKAATSSRGIETETGKTLIPSKEVDATDIGGLALGLPTRHIDEAKRANKQIQDVKAGAGDTLQRLAAQHVDGIMGKDPAAVSAAMKGLREHNAEARRSHRTSELISPQTYQAAVKAEMSQRRGGVLDNRGIPKKDFLQVQELRKSSAGYKTADEPGD